MTTETQGSLLVLFGFLFGFAGMVIRMRPSQEVFGNGVAVLSVAMVVVGCVVSIAGKKRG